MAAGSGVTARSGVAAGSGMAAGSADSYVEYQVYITPFCLSKDEASETVHKVSHSSPVRPVNEPEDRTAFNGGSIRLGSQFRWGFYLEIFFSVAFVFTILISPFSTNIDAGTGACSYCRTSLSLNPRDYCIPVCLPICAAAETE